MEVISGQYSPVGRQTERSLRRLRTQVEAEEALLLPKTPKAEDSKQNEPDSPKSEKINLERFPWPNSPSKAGKLNRSGTLSSFHLTGSTVATLNGTTGSNGSFEETTNKSEEKDEEASKSLKASVAFSAMGQDAGQLCEVARSKYRRFMLPSRDSRPQAGHYRVNDSCSFQRPPEWDIGQRPLHQGRKVRQKDTGMELGEMYNGFADGLASQGKFQPMSLSPWRPDVTSLCTHPMTFAPAHQKEWCKLDAASSQSTRAPDLVLGGHAPNHDKQSPYRTVPLDEPIECNEVSHAASEEAYPEPHFGRLENGVQVIAVDRQGLCSSLGLYVHTGSRFISKEHAALPHMLELMAFRSSAHLSHLRTQKTLEQLGAAASCRVGREDVLFQMDVLREYVPVALPLMLANVLCPSVLPDEVAEAQQHVVELQQMMEEKPESWVVELLHVAAYKDNTLGHALYATEQDLPLCSPENIQRFIAEECTPDRLTVVGVNVDFQELCKWTARSFAEQGHTHHASQGPRDLQLAKYTGGEIRVARPNPLCHLIFGWEVPGGWNGQWLAAVTVLQMFLGGGGSFSTGGPGKGMHTRLYTEVLNRYHWAESCQASSVMYIDSGLLTVYATVMPQFGSQFHNVLAQIFEGVAKMSNIELERAKNALKSSIHMNLEMRAVMMEDMGRQMVLSGKVGTAQEFTRMVDAITKEDLVEALRVCLKSPVSLVAFGAIEQVSPYEQIAKRFSDVTLR